MVKRSIRTRLKAVLAAATVAAGMALSVQATVYSNCFEVVMYSDLRHIACTVDGLTDIHYVIDKFGTNNWDVLSHGGGTESGIVEAMPEEHVLTDNLFTDAAARLTGSAYPFVFEFYHWFKNGSSGKTWYGYASLGLDENAELVVLESAITDRQGELTVRGSPEPTSPSDIETIDHGDWLELDSTCIYSEAEGWIAIPSEIDGKPIRAIGRAAFATCRRMTRLTIPDTIVSIGEGAFTDCIALTELAIPNSVTNIGKNLVYGCDALGEIRVGNRIASIPKGAFFGSGVTNLVLSVGTTNIEEYAFAASASLKSVTIPQSVERIKGGAFNGCVSLKEVSVPYATVVEADAFPSGCEVTRYGPRIWACSAAKLDDETLSALMRTLDWRTYHSMEYVEFFAACPPYAEECDSDEAPIACAHLGISPLAIWSEDGKDYIQPYYRMPSVEFIGIDPSTRTITGRVVPAEGTSIVSMPFKRAFGFHRLYEDNGTMREGDDWGRKTYLGCEGFAVDFSDYMASNGLFRITFPEEVLEEKSPQPAHLFRIKLSDKDRGLW